MAAVGAFGASALPQSSQNTDDGAFSAPHFGHLLDIGLPHAAQNFLPVLLSVPHFEHRIAVSRLEAGMSFYHPPSGTDSRTQIEP